MVITQKPNGDLRKILMEHYQLPKKEDIFVEMSGAKWFSKLDASHAFWQVKLSDNSRYYKRLTLPLAGLRQAAVWSMFSAEQRFWAYLRPKTHIQHTHPQHLSTSTQTSTNHKSTHCNRMG